MTIDPRDICARLEDLDDGTGALGVIVRQALQDNPMATEDDICEIVEEIVEEATEDARVEEERSNR